MVSAARDVAKQRDRRSTDLKAMKKKKTTKALHVKLSGRRYKYSKGLSLGWESDPPPDSRIQFEYIGSFSARGLRRVYGLQLDLGHKARFHLDIWRDRKGNLFVRFWSRNAEVENESLTIRGILPDSIPERADWASFSDAWLPKALRDEFEGWINDEW